MDRHLNIYEFFNGSDAEYLEDNLSRAFALTLKYDSVFLDNILKNILSQKDLADLFDTDFPNYSINIDLQKRTSDIGEMSKIIGVACSALEIDEEIFNSVIPRLTDDPITDIVIEINDTLIVFEFKRTREDCSSQLKNQIERIKDIRSGDISVSYKDLNWKKIIKIALNVLSLQKQINSENKFTSDFIKFIEKKHPDWFPTRLLKNIPFPKNENDPNNYYLNARLDQIKGQVFGFENIKEVTGKYNRRIIAVDWGWANEIHLGSYYDRESKGEYLSLEIFAGDTKGQGGWFFKNDTVAIKWPKTIDAFELEVDPYIKFSHFNSTLFWYSPTPEEYEKTHNYKFFHAWAGRYQKAKGDWEKFEIDFEKIAPAWRTKCEYDAELLNSNRTYFDLSVGTYLILYIPYKKTQDMDNNEFASQLSQVFKSIALQLKNIIDA